MKFTNPLIIRTLKIYGLHSLIYQRLFIKFSKRVYFTNSNRIEYLVMFFHYLQATLRRESNGLFKTEHILIGMPWNLVFPKVRNLDRYYSLFTISDFEMGLSLKYRFCRWHDNFSSCGRPPFYCIRFKQWS